jgi:flagellar biosynthesis anti-sigma factor FlgM
MKIEQHRAGLETTRTDATETSTAAAAARAGRATTAPAADQVQVSSGAQLAGAAVKAATGAPDIREAEVERARALLESGQLGADAEQLADALIDRALDGD